MKFGASVRKKNNQDPLYIPVIFVAESQPSCNLPRSLIHLRLSYEQCWASRRGSGCCCWSWGCWGGRDMHSVNMTVQERAAGALGRHWRGEPAQLASRSWDTLFGTATPCVLWTRLCKSHPFPEWKCCQLTRKSGQISKFSRAQPCLHYSRNFPVTTISYTKTVWCVMVCLSRKEMSW